MQAILERIRRARQSGGEAAITRSGAMARCGGLAMKVSKPSIIATGRDGNAAASTYGINEFNEHPVLLIPCSHRVHSGRPACSARRKRGILADAPRYHAQRPSVGTPAVCHAAVLLLSF